MLKEADADALRSVDALDNAFNDGVIMGIDRIVKLIKRQMKGKK